MPENISKHLKIVGIVENVEIVEIVKCHQQHRFQSDEKQNLRKALNALSLCGNKLRKNLEQKLFVLKIQQKSSKSRKLKSS